MKEINKTAEKKIFKKIFVKICRFFGYEIIDQGNFYVPTQKKSLSENLNIQGKKSILIYWNRIVSHITQHIKFWSLRKVHTGQLVLIFCSFSTVFSSFFRISSFLIHKILKNLNKKYVVSIITKYVNRLNFSCHTIKLPLSKF